jgi:hypothetical protein
MARIDCYLCEHYSERRGYCRLDCRRASNANGAEVDNCDDVYFCGDYSVFKCEQCGKEFKLQDHYCGACECPNCGEWYNLCGQHLNPPEQWEEPIDYDY